MRRAGSDAWRWLTLRIPLRCRMGDPDTGIDVNVIPPARHVTRYPVHNYLVKQLNHV
jgi:hypothetical protein